MRNKFKSIFLVLAAALAACSYQVLWTKRIIDPGQVESFATEATLDGQGNLVVAGTIAIPPSPNSRSDAIPFISKYDPNGNLLWDYRGSPITGGGSIIEGVTDIVADNAGNVYATVTYWFDLSSVHTKQKIVKIGGDGAVLWEWVDNKEVCCNLAIGYDGNLYTAAGSRIFSLDLNGNLRWEKISDNSSSNGFKLTGSILVDEGGIVGYSGDHIYRFDYDGNLVQQVSGEEIGLTEIQSVTNNKYRLAAIGKVGNTTKARILVNLVPEGELLELGNTRDYDVTAAPRSDASFCFMLSYFNFYDVSISELITGAFTSDGAMLWKTVEEGNIAAFPLVPATSSGDACYFSYLKFDSDRYLSTFNIKSESKKSVTKPLVIIPDFLGTVVLPSGSNFYSVGGKMKADANGTPQYTGAIYKH